MTLKLKPVELHELQNIKSATSFSLYDGKSGKSHLLPESTTLAEAAKLVLGDPSERILIYAYNKRAEESGVLSRFILLTEHNIKLYLQWSKENG